LRDCSQAVLSIRDGVGGMKFKIPKHLWVAVIAYNIPKMLEEINKKEDKGMLQTTEGTSKGHSVVRIIKRCDTEHECQVCGKDFSGKNAALVELDNGQDAIVCSECADKV